MSLKYYQNYLQNLSHTPSQHWNDGMQAFVNSVWDNSTQTQEIVTEETFIGSKKYDPVNVSVDMAIELATGTKRPDDFKTFSYKDLSIDTIIGTMYYYSDNYWIAVKTDEYGSPTKSVGVRRCNNIARWIDPDNGALIEQHCILDYNYSGTQPKYQKDVNTPNGNKTLIIQGNSHTLKLKKNQRFVFNGQPFVLNGIDNFQQPNAVSENTTILFFNISLDLEYSQYDDYENNIANAYSYLYSINIIDNLTEQISGYEGKLNTEIKLNNEIVSRKVVWTGNKFVDVQQDGSYIITGVVGKVATITASIEGNKDVFDVINITIVEEAEDQKEIVIDPLYVQIRQDQTIEFTVDIYNNGVKLPDIVTCVPSGVPSNYYTLDSEDNKFKLTSHKVTKTPLNLTFSDGDIARTIQIELKSLF